MFYTSRNFRTKKALKAAVAAGKPIGVFAPGIGPQAPSNGTVSVGGPQYPEPHRWYARVTLADGLIVKVS